MGIFDGLKKAKKSVKKWKAKCMARNAKIEADNKAGKAKIEAMRQNAKKKALPTKPAPITPK